MPDRARRVCRVFGAATPLWVALALGGFAEEAAQPASPSPSPAGGAPAAPSPAAVGQAPPAATPDQAGAAPKTGEFDQRIKEWFYRHYVKNEEVAIAQGEWAILRQNGCLDIDRPLFTFFREVEGTSRREKVTVAGATGQFNRGASRARLEGQVVVREEDGSELRTEHLDLDLLQRRLTTEDRVEIRKPDLVLTGVGLDGSRLLHVMILQSKVAVSVRGVSADTLLGAGPSDASKASPAGETFVTCDGPATLVHLASPRPETDATDELRLANRVAISRHDPSGLMRFLADAATVDLFHGAAPAPAAGGAPPMVTDPRRAVLTGNVQVFEERGLTGTAERLVWTRADESLQLEGESGVRIARTTHTIQGKRVVVLRRENRVTSRGDAQATFSPQAGAVDAAARESAPTWTLRSRSLEAWLRPEGNDIDRLDAAGDVTLAADTAPGGSAGGPRRQTATGESFRWNAASRQGLLAGSPATVQEGPDRMEASRIALFPVEQRILLQGPKRIELAGRVSATARGDMAISHAEGTIEIGEGATVSTPEMRMEADRLRMDLARSGGDGIRGALGWGHVHVVDRVNASEIFGDTLRWDVPGEEVAVVGMPFAKIVQGNIFFQGQEFWVSRRTGDIRAVNRAGTQGRIRVQPEGEKSAN